MPNIGPWELLIILFIVVLIFGAGKIPQLGKSLGEGIRNFQASIKGDKKDSTKPGAGPETKNN